MIWLNEDSFDRRDAAVITGVAVLGGMLAWLVLQQMGSFHFYQMFTPEALMWACGQGFRHPLPMSPDMVEFLVDRRSPSFDCASIAHEATSGPAGVFSTSQIYLTYFAAGLWRVLGPTQLATWPLGAVLAAGYSTGTYVLARLFLGRLLSTVAGLVLTVSPVAVGMIYMLRDFSKAPFFIWGIALLLLAARVGTPLRASVLALVAGVVVGIGYGFRADIAILLPLGIGLLAVASRLRIMLRATPVAAYATSFLLLAAPILALGNAGGAGSLVMQGATEPFRSFLALRPAPYTLGQSYSDELTLGAIAVAERPRHPDWDVHEPAPIYGVSQAIAYSSANLFEWAPNFPADFAAQALKGAGWILGYPALFATSRGSVVASYPMRQHMPLVRWQEPIYSLFGKPWMPIVGFVGLLALLTRVAARNGREAIALAGLFLALLLYPVVQFGGRHIFHLEFIFFFSVLSLFAAVREWRLLRSVFPRAIISATALLGIMAIAYIGLADLQQSQLTTEFSALLALPGKPVVLEREARDDGAVLLRAAVPPDYEAVVDGPIDSMNDRIRDVGLENQVLIRGDRMLLTLGGPACPAEQIALQVTYDHRPHLWQAFDQTLVAGLGDTIIFPAFYRATQSFAGILLPASHAGCEATLSRLPLTNSLPFVLTAVLPADWRSLPLRKGLGRFDVGPQH